jgi:hypothetical protein
MLFNQQLSFPLALSCLLATAPPADRADETRVCVVAIIATDRNTTVDEKIKCIAKEVQKKEPTLTGFRMATTNCKPLTAGAKESFPLIEGEVASVVVEGKCKGERVRLTVKAPLMGEITYSTTCGKYFPIVTRYQTKDKDRLIIAVMVKPECKGK